MTVEYLLSDAGPKLAIEPLLETDIDRLRFSVWARTSNQAAKDAIASFPGRSVWIADTMEYAIVAPWRHRTEIANVVELSAVRHPAELLTSVVRRSGTAGSALVISIEIDETRSPMFYERAGFSLLEEVITYELDCTRWHKSAAQSGNLEFLPVDIGQLMVLPRLVELDHRSFPWLWWNSPEEFVAYAASPGVELFIGLRNGAPVSYLGITSYLGWGHLDRIAVVPDQQGQGLGREALDFAIARLIQLGARKVGLSTQRQNVRSRRLYERAGFRHAVSNDYRLYGRILRLPEGVDSATELI